MKFMFIMEYCLCCNSKRQKVWREKVLVAQLGSTLWFIMIFLNFDFLKILIKFTIILLLYLSTLFLISPNTFFFFSFFLSGASLGFFFSFWKPWQGWFEQKIWCGSPWIILPRSFIGFWNRIRSILILYEELSLIFFGSLPIDLPIRLELWVFFFNLVFNFNLFVVAASVWLLYLDMKRFHSIR